MYDDEHEEYYQVPYVLDHLICSCEQPVYFTFQESQEARKNGGDVNDRTLKDTRILCKTCMKVVRYRVLRCRECHQYYLNMFQHPGKSKGGSVCYPCLDEKFPEFRELDDEYLDSRPSRVPPPTWFQPREPLNVAAVMADEIDLDFDF